MDEVRPVLDEILGAEWQSLIPNIIETCRSRPSHGPGGGNKGKGHRCNPVKEMFLFCVHEHIITQCPDSLWIDGRNFANLFFVDAIYRFSLSLCIR